MIGESLSFSLNATVPVFLVMALGYLLKNKAHMINDEFIRVANRLNFKVALPCLLFMDVLNADIRSNFDLRFVLYCAIVTSIIFWGLWGCAKLFIKDKGIIGAFVQASYRSSAAILGAAIVQNIYGDSGMVPLMIVGAVPLYNIYAVLVLSMEGSEKSERTIGSAVKNAVTNPIILGILAGLLASFLPFQIPEMASSAITSLGRTATPLAVLCIGGSFDFADALRKKKPAVAATVLKLAVWPVLFLPLAVAMGYSGSKLVAILIMLGSPTTPSCYIMAQNMHNDGQLTASIIVLTTVCSAFTLTGFLFVLRFAGLI